MTARPADVRTGKCPPAPDAGLTLTAAELAAAIEVEADVAVRLLGVAAAMVLQYAPGAPEALKNEAAIRFAGYLSQSDYGTVAKESIGPRDVEYVTNHAPAFRNSGAAMLLSRWRVRRAGAIG